MKVYKEIKYLCPITKDSFVMIFTSDEVMNESLRLAGDKYGTLHEKEPVSRMVIDKSEDFLQVIEDLARKATLDKLTPNEKKLLGIVAEKREPPKTVIHYDPILGAGHGGLCSKKPDGVDGFTNYRDYPNHPISQDEVLCEECLKLWYQETDINPAYAKTHFAKSYQDLRAICGFQVGTKGEYYTPLKDQFQTAINKCRECADLLAIGLDKKENV